ncbi:glutathione S-transferase, partial [Glonium stellatum]
IANDRITLYVKKASPTSTANTVKPLILLEALSIPHSIHIIDSTTTETWFHTVNPYKMVPAMEDVVVAESEHPSNEERINVFDSSACLLYLVDKYDKEGVFGGKGLRERASVISWLMGYTAGLGATGKSWLMLKPKNVGDVAMSVFVTWIRNEYAILDWRLSEPDQEYIALPARPTIADIAILPLANEKVAATAEICFDDYPALKRWSERMAKLPYVAKALNRVGKFG